MQGTLSPPTLMLIAALLLVITGTVAGWWLTRVAPRCPACGGRHIQETSAEPERTRIYIDNEGGQSGGRTEVRFDMRVQYHCRDCDHRWTAQEIRQ